MAQPTNNVRTETIPFNRSPITGQELEYIREALENHNLTGDGPFTKRCEKHLEKQLGAERVLLTPSCTAALEMSALLADIGPGDEVIMPSYTFVSTANAFVLRGAKIVFVDVRPDTMNIDQSLIQDAITKRTKAIVPVHYAGVSCDMESILTVAKENGLLVIEDAAQGVQADYQGRPLGSIGEMGCLSFHATKNIVCGEGGALILRDPHFVERAEILREKGTDRSRFHRGEIDKYSWVDIGSSQLPSELQAAHLLAQLEAADEITQDRLNSWKTYYEGLRGIEELQLPIIPQECSHNAHMFYVKLQSQEARDALMQFLKEQGVTAIFHYVPLHTSLAGQKYSRFHGEDRFTTGDSSRLLRLPLYFKLTGEEIRRTIQLVQRFFSTKTEK